MAAAARVTSGPMPSPGSRTMLFFMVVPVENRNSSKPHAPSRKAEKRRASQLSKLLTEARSGGRRRFRGHRRGTPPNHFMSDGDNVARAYQLGFISQGRHAAVNFRKLGIARIVTQVAQGHTQRVPSGVLSENQRTRRNSNRLRGNDFVSERVLDDSILVNARFVRESVRANNRFIRGDLRPRDFGKHAARGKQLLQPDAGRYSEAVLADRQRDDDFFERGISGALADAVDRALDLTDAGANRCERIRHRHPQV